MEYEYDTYDYETLQDEIAIEMASEARLEEYQMNGFYDEDLEQEEVDYWIDPYDDWAEVENREMLGVEAYAHWNEDAHLIWWMEEGRHQ